MFDSLKKLWSHPQTARPATSSWRTSRLWGNDSGHTLGLSLLRVVAVAHHQRLDLPQLVKLLSNENCGLARRRLMRLAGRLEQGTPLVEAIEQQPGLLSDEQVLELRLAQQSGTTTQTLVDLIRRATERSRESTNQVLQAVTYGLGLTLAVGLILTFLMVFVSPTYQAMFTEFGLKLPTLLRNLSWWASSVARHLPLIAMAGGLLTAVLWYFRPHRWLRNWVSSRIGKSTVQLRVSQLLRMLASSLEAGRPLPGALSTLARYHFDRNVQIKLLFARNEVEQGSSTWRSLAKTNLLSNQEAEAIEQASTDSLRAWMIRQLASEKEERVQLHRAFLAMLVHPAIILFLGCIVLWVCVAYFTVLITMITSLS